MERGEELLFRIVTVSFTTTNPPTYTWATRVIVMDEDVPETTGARQTLDANVSIKRKQMSPAVFFKLPTGFMFSRVAFLSEAIYLLFLVLLL